MHDARSRRERGFDARMRAQAAGGRFCASSPAANKTPGLEVLVQEVMAAINTSPSPTSICGSSVGRRDFRSSAFLPKPP